MAIDLKMKLSLVLFAFLALSLPATSSGSDLTSINVDEFRVDLGDFDHYLRHYRLWEVLVNHGVQV